MCYNKAKKAKDKFPPWSPDNLRRFPVLVMLFLSSHMAHYLGHTENSDVVRYSIREQMPLCIIPSAAPLEPASVRLYLQMSGTKWRCCTRRGRCLPWGCRWVFCYPILAGSSVGTCLPVMEGF